MFLEVQSRAGVEEDAYDIITNNGPVEMRCGAGLLLDCRRSCTRPLQVCAYCGRRVLRDVPRSHTVLCMAQLWHFCEYVMIACNGHTIEAPSGESPHWLGYHTKRESPRLFCTRLTADSE